MLTIQFQSGIPNYAKKTSILPPDRSCAAEQPMKNKIRRSSLTYKGKKIPVLTGEFWTTRQRQAANLHEIAYRACFKPALPKYFITRFTKPGDIVYDPFCGRGTTVIEAALLGRNIIANDINPISAILAEGRLVIPDEKELEERLEEILHSPAGKGDHNLKMFFHRDTLQEILQIRNWLKTRKRKGKEDALDKWIRMVATNRLTGHSKGFFSVYTLPPNQALTRDRQIKINRERKQKPTYRNTKDLILRKTRSLKRHLENKELKNLQKAAPLAQFINKDAGATAAIKRNSVQLTVTSPPFLDIVQYAKDNWLRCWFNDIDAVKVGKQITMSKTIEEWMDVMQNVFHELYRITKKGGVVAFEVGEVRYGKIKLEEFVVPLGINAGFTCKKIIINAHAFTKTANIWGIDNNAKGTNSNRIVVFIKP